MLQVRPILKRLTANLPRHQLSNLSTGILTAMCAGLLMPALIGGLLLTNLRLEQVNKEMDSHLDQTTTLLARSLATPVWNYNTDAAGAIVDASMLDPQIVRITITVSTPEQNGFLAVERPERRIGRSRVKRDDLMLFGEKMGQVEVEIDDGLRQSAFQHDKRAYFLILLGQFVFSLLLILVAVRVWVLKPLAHLTTFSNRLASGNLEQPVGWTQPDEIGQLARQLDQMRRSLRTSFAEQQAILGNIQVGVVFVRDHTIVLANRHAEHIFGYTQGEMHGLPTRVFYLSDDQHAAIGDRALSAIATTDGHYEEELRLQRRDGGPFWARMRGCALEPHNPHAGSIWVYEDISTRKAAEDEINSLAFYDTLTGLPNRRLLLDRLKQALASAPRSEKNGALLLIDLDNFKTLNDTLGHELGDRLLQQAGARLTARVRDGDTVARPGGDEFVVMLENLSANLPEAAAHAQQIGDEILAALRQPYQLDEHRHHSTASIGIALFGDLGKQQMGVDDLLKKAELALYQAKGAGRNTQRFFDPQMQAVASTRAVLEAGLRDAVSKNQLVLYYQVQVDENGRATGVEALVRWQHPQRGLVPPAEFIPLAEETGLIQSLGHWVLETACYQLAAWATQTALAPLSIAVNASARQLRNPEFVTQVMSVLEATGALPQRLKLELTESLLVDDIEDTISKMAALKALGVRFSLDDFGTGYSSLAYLKRLPLDQLKIDQSFVRDILANANDASIARMFVVLADNLGLAVIAEGVETEAQKAFLAQQGCLAYQGYLFGRPLPANEFERVFHSQMQGITSSAR